MARRKKRRGLPPPKRARLKDNHTWTAPDGYKIVVLDRGAVSFNIPYEWVVSNMQPFEVYDREPPDDNTRLSVSYWRSPPGIDWSDLSLEDLLANAVKDTDDEPHDHREMVKPAREDLEIVWAEYGFDDPIEHRPAFSRNAIARGWDVHALFTLDFWAEDREKLEAMWQEVLRSLQMGRYIEDPTRGEVLH